MVLHSAGGFSFIEEGFISDIHLLEKENRIEQIHLNVDGFYNPVVFQETWKYFAPQKIFEDYGVPDEVYIYVFDNKNLGDSGGMTFYYLWLVYEKVGFFVKYTGQVKCEPVFHICPQFDQGTDIRQLEMRLQSPGSSFLVEREIDGSMDADSTGMMSLEIAANITPEQLYNRFAKTDQTGCFDTELSFWEK